MHWEIHPPRPLRFPSGGDFAPLGPRDFPRASPSGNLSGLGVQNPRPWEISRASGDVFPNTSLLSAVYGFNARELRHLTDTIMGVICDKIVLIGSFQCNLTRPLQENQKILYQSVVMKYTLICCFVRYIIHFPFCVDIQTLLC